MMHITRFLLGKIAALPLILLAGVMLWASSAAAQQTFIVNDPGKYQRFLDARQWFTSAQYKLAYPVFKELEQAITTPVDINQQLYVEELQFYMLACELMEDNPGAEPKAQGYLSSNAGSYLKGQLGYYLGSFYFRQQRYAEAINAFDKANVSNLNNEQVATLQFQQGYAYFTQKQFAQAKPLLNSVRQSVASPYYADANYYYGLLAFNDKQYKEALQSFEVVRYNKKYEDMVPYYIAGINYAIGEKDKAIEQAEAALKKRNPYYESALLQLVGHGYFEKGEYAKAKPYLEQYVKSADKVKKEDLYELAYCYYISQQYTKAIEQFKPLAGGDDSLSQHAMYLLGDAYLKTGQKNNARNAFLFCSSNSSNDQFKEISLFNYGKLSYELGYDNEALPALKQYVDIYRQGTYITEAKDLLVGVLGNTSNYKEALDLYESLPAKSEMAKSYFPRIAYNRAQELINDRNVAGAELLLKKVLTAPYNESVISLAHFWLGEIDFGKNEFASAVQHFQAYLSKPQIQGEANVTNAKYSLGYSLLRLQEYKQAGNLFAEIAKGYFANEHQQTDVLLRLADCAYMQKDFGKSLPIYNQVAAKRGYGADYALYQAGMIAGAQNRAAEKINLLRSIETLYPNSSLIAIANMEIADTYLADEKFKEAIPFLAKIIASKGNESMKPTAYLKTGLAQYNLDQLDEALNAFSTLLKQYPQSPESEEAIDNVRSIYVEQGNPDLYVSFLKSVGRSVDQNVADSLTYVAAEMQLLDGKKQQALAGFNKYTEQFPNGRYIVDAHYYAAELNREMKAMANAMMHYDAVAKLAPNKYAEKSLLMLARYYYFDEKNYSTASGYYSRLKQQASNNENRLEAMRGLARCQYYLNDFANAVVNAKELLQQGGAGSDDKVFANLIIGKQAKADGNCAEAITAFKSVAALSKAEFGAEARYQIAACYFEMQKLADAEKAAFEVIQKSGSYANWVERSYILLGDIYLKQEDYFNAKATYKSVADNATIPELKAEAASKLAKAESMSAAASKIGGQ